MPHICHVLLRHEEVLEREVGKPCGALAKIDFGFLLGLF